MLQLRNRIFHFILRFNNDVYYLCKIVVYFLVFHLEISENTANFNDFLSFFWLYYMYNCKYKFEKGRLQKRENELGDLA